jgi:hypothetical protein
MTKTTVATIRIEEEAWSKFKVHCAKNSVKYGRELERIIEEYLKREVEK